MMDERQVERLSACMSGIANVSDLTERMRGAAEDVVGAGMEGAEANGDTVVVYRQHLEKKAREIVDTYRDSEILEWVSADTRAERMIEEYVKASGGWNGNNLIALLRGCHTYALLRIVYAGMVSVKTVTIK